MSFCDFVPDDPACQTAVEPTPVEPETETKAEIMIEEHDMEDKMEMTGDPLMGNITYTAIAAGLALQQILMMTRYSTEDEFIGGQFDGTNLWQYSTMAMRYTSLVGHSILTITQILSMAGIAADVNIMAWMYLSMVGSVVSLLVSIVRMYVYDTAYTASEGTAVSVDYTNEAGTTFPASNVMGADATMDGIEADIMSETIMGTAAMLSLYKENKNWMMAQWEALPAEKQEAMQKKGEKKGEKMGEKMEEMFGFFQF